MSADDPAEPPSEDAFEPAAEHLEAALVPRHASRFATAVRVLVSTVVGLIANDVSASPLLTDLRVVRRDSGHEVLRVCVGDLAEADRLLLQVRRDLDAKSVSQFISEWHA